MSKSQIASCVATALALSACTHPSGGTDSYRSYLSGVPIAPVQNCVDRAADVAGKLQSAAGQRGVWWDCGHVAKKEEMGRIARLVAGGAFGVGEYPLAKAAADYVEKLPSDGLTTKDRADLRQLGALAGALSKAPAMIHSPSMTYSGAKTVRLPASYDHAGLLRVPILANGKEVSAVLDTGAAMSLMVESMANRLGLKINAGSDVASSTRESVPTNWVLVPRMEIGEVIFVNVIFLVVPDQALGLPAGYTIEAILGHPVLLQLQTVCVTGKTVTFAPASSDNRPAPADADVRFVDSAPMVSMRVNGAPVTAFLDSGANASKLSRSFAKAFPRLIVSGRSPTITEGGVGGTRQSAVASLKDAQLAFGSNTITMSELQVDLAKDEDSSAPSATIGQDVLRAAKAWKLDYPNAHFRLSAQCP